MEEAIKFFLFFILLFYGQIAWSQEPRTGQAPERTQIEGTLSQVSKLPTATTNPYPDCYYTAIIDIKHITSGKSIAQRVILVIPGFFSRKYAPEAQFKTGDKVKATVVPFSSMPEKVRQTQQADEIEDVDLDFYFPEKITAIQNFQRVDRPLPFAVKRSKVEEAAAIQLVDQKARSARQAVLRQDLEQIEKALMRHDGDWDEWYDSVKDFRDRYQKQYDTKAQRWIGDSYFSAGKMEYGKGYSPEFVKSVITFKNYLAARNVDLILVRVPQKGELVDDLFAPPAPTVSNPYLLRMYKELLEADVEIVTDIVPRGKEARSKYPLMYYYQSFDEEHPAEGTSWVVAEAVAKRLDRYEKVRNAVKAQMSLRQVSLPATSFHWPPGNPRFNPAEPVSFSSVVDADGKALKLEQGSTSPVLVVGSSFIGSPSMEQAGNIPAYLAFLTGVVPDILYRNGSNAIIPRTIAREGDGFLKNRSVCIFPFVPWAIHGPLDEPPIVDPAKAKRILLASHAGRDLKAKVAVAAGTPAHVFTYAPDGTLLIQARDKGSRDGGKFRLTLPQTVRNYPYLMIEIESGAKDVAVIKATYGTQTDTIHKSFSQESLVDSLVFKSGSEVGVSFDLNNIHPDVPTTIKSIKVYGLQP